MKTQLQERDWYPVRFQHVAFDVSKASNHPVPARRQSSRTSAAAAAREIAIQSSSSSVTSRVSYACVA